MKSTVDEIRLRFDADVERFSNLETGQSATRTRIVSPLYWAVGSSMPASLNSPGPSR